MSMLMLKKCREFPLLRSFIHREWHITRRLVPLSSMSTLSGGLHTIYALATGGIRCALAVVRISGPSSSEVLSKLGKFPQGKLPEPRKATLRKLYDPISNKIIDHGIVIWFPGPKSYTGEDTCEVHLHGSKAVINSIFEAIQKVSGCRMAEPGEFSKRAFFNGKMDLTAVEGVGDLISAETEMQRVQALNQMSGSLGSLYGSWKDRLAKCVANAEAFIDFGEDENIESNIMDKVKMEVESIYKEMRNHISDHRKGERLRNGVRITILGKPNVGKSSLLNILTKRDTAIVSSIPGTTRDVIEACIDFNGYPVVFADTAGIRLSPDEIEKEGIRRARKEAHNSDIVLLVASYLDISKKLDNQRSHHKSAKICRHRNGNGGLIDAGTVPTEVFKTEFIQQELTELVFQETGNEEDESAKEFLEKVLFVANKMDLEPVTNPSTEKGVDVKSNLEDIFDVLISCKEHTGIEKFIDLLTEKVAKMCSDPKFESPCLTRERYRSHLQNCMENLQLYLDPEDFYHEDLALRTHHLKSAMNNIGYITGHVGTEDILDIIFRDFCIGK